MPINNGQEYIESLRNRNLKVYLFGELVKEPVDHPMIRPSINAVAETYDIANEDPSIALLNLPFLVKELTGSYILPKMLQI